MLLAVEKPGHRYLVSRSREHNAHASAASPWKDAAGDGVGNPDCGAETLQVVKSPNPLAGNVDLIKLRAICVDAELLGAWKRRATRGGNRRIARRMIDTQCEVTSEKG